MTSQPGPLSGPPPLDKLRLDEDSAIEGFLRVLEEHQRQCEVSGNYAEADAAKKRILELRLDNENKKREALRAKQVKERLMIENQHLFELEQFKKNWEKMVSEFDEKAGEQTGEARERQDKDLLTLQTKQEKQLEGLKPRWSKEVLNLRRIQESLAKQKQYVEAQQVKAKIDQLEEAETEKARAAKREAMALAEEKLLAKQQLEMEGALKRLSAARGDLIRQRQTDAERLQQQHWNGKVLLEKRHNAERVRMEKQLKGVLTSHQGLVEVDGRRGTSSKIAAGSPVGVGPGAPGKTRAFCDGAIAPSEAEQRQVSKSEPKGSIRVHSARAKKALQSDI